MADPQDLEKMLAQYAKALPRSDDAAAQLAAQWKTRDPFPTIAASLLNSADICAYVATSGMIHPFYPTTQYLKPASYAFRLLGPAVYWDDKDKKITQEIGEKDEFDLRPNSIAFVTLEPQLRLPDYIALRFNLKIHNVYRGLLLGTGPLIDPGFEGRLSIPLHNLTNNNYKFHGGESLIWVEFTKLSTNPRWHSGADAQTRNEGLYVPYPEPKTRRVVNDFLREADPNRSIASSLPITIGQAREAAESARKAANRLQIGGVILTLLAVAGLLGVVFSALNLTRALIQDTRQEARSHIAAQDTVANRVRILEHRLDSIARVNRAAAPRPASRAPQPGAN